jgi:DNA replication protein DnaC
MGFVTRNVPVGHPDFGKSFPCACKKDELYARRSQRLYRLSNLDALYDKVFNTFIVDLPNLTDDQLGTLRSSSELAWRYAENPAGWLLLQGNYGSGKTHLAAAIANHRLSLNEPVLFLTVPDLLDHLRSTYGPSSEVNYDKLFDQVRSAPLLVLDDLGAESATPWAQEKLYQVINHRYTHRLPTVITTNSNLDDLDPRIRSRLVDHTLTASSFMDLPDFRRFDAAQEQNPLFNLTLYHDMQFETFDTRQHEGLPQNERRNLLKAFQLALEYAEDPQGWLLFLGDHGCGKTHLAAAIVNYHHRVAHVNKVVMVTMPDLLDYLRAAFNPDTAVPLAQRFHEIRTAPLLIMDQLDTTNATPWALEKLRQLTDYRYLAQLPTVFTTNTEIEKLDARIRSRVSDSRLCHIFVMLAPDYKGGNAASHRPTY